MKKLFTIALSALMLVGVSACGGAKNYDDTVNTAGKNQEGYDVKVYLDGAFAGWGANKDFVMTATSVKGVSEFSTEVADKLAGKKLDWIYVIEHKFEKGEGAGWDTGYYDEAGAYQEKDGNYAFKFNEGYYNPDKEIEVAETWIPNPADTGAKKVEGLTSNVFVPPYQKEKDEHELDWNSNLVCRSEEGTYKVVLAKYQQVSTATVNGYGVALVKIA